MLDGDALMGNMCLDGGAAGFCDWQTIRYGRPSFDVAYFIGSSLESEAAVAGKGRPVEAIIS